jgi:hypothetical protein
LTRQSCGSVRTSALQSVSLLPAQHEAALRPPLSANDIAEASQPGRRCPLGPRAQQPIGRVFVEQSQRNKLPDGNKQTSRPEALLHRLPLRPADQCSRRWSARRCNLVARTARGCGLSIVLYVVMVWARGPVWCSF